MRISDWSSDVCSSDLFDEAWAYYAAARPGSDQRQSRDPAFTSAIEARSAFDWTAVNGSGVSTAILPEAGNGLFDFTVSMGKDRKEHTSELQSLMRSSYAVFCLKKKIHRKRER